MKTLTHEEAASLAQRPECLNLLDVASVTPEIAKTLAKHETFRLSLGVTHLSAEVARALAEHRGGCLHLSQLKELTPDAAAELAVHNGMLEIGVETLSVETARSLAAHQGDQLLLKLKTLAPQAATVLSAHSRCLCVLIDRLSAETARGLARHRGRLLTLWTVTEVTPDVAAALATHTRALSLWAESLTVDAARRLAAHQGDLGLDHISTLPLPVAAELAKHSRRLTLGIESLSAEVAWQLAAHRGRCLTLKRLTHITTKVAAALATHRGILRLPALKVISMQAARTLARHGGQLRFSELRLPADAARHLERRSADDFVEKSKDEQRLRKQHAPCPEWLEAVLATAMFSAQRSFIKRGYAGDEVFKRLLHHLDKRGGQMTQMALARAIDYPPFRMAGLLTQAQRLFNVDGYPVITVDMESDTVSFERRTLLVQFGISDPGSDQP